MHLAATRNRIPAVRNGFWKWISKWIPVSGMVYFLSRSNPSNACISCWTPLKVERIRNRAVWNVCMRAPEILLNVRYILNLKCRELPRFLDDPNQMCRTLQISGVDIQPYTDIYIILILILILIFNSWTELNWWTDPNLSPNRTLSFQIT